MQKRTVIFGAYNTAAHGWTLTGWQLSDPEQKTRYIEKTNGDGSWDWSTIMSEGIPRYQDRTLTVTLECSEGTRVERQKLISEMVNALDGFEWQVILPDYPNHYLTGRIHVIPNYNDLAHASVTVTGVFRPWLYKAQETILVIDATSSVQDVIITNSGRLAMVPTITVTGSGDVRLVYGTASIQMSDGTYEWPTLLLTPGNHPVKISGKGTVTFKYREAVLR